MKTRLKAKAPATRARILRTRIKLAGKKTRIKAHLSAATRRQQVKRDRKRARRNA